MVRLRNLLSLLLLGAAPGVRAEVSVQQIVDEGAFAIFRDGTVIGREEFTIRRGRPGAADGLTVTTTAYYPAERPTRTIMAAVALAPDSQAATAQFELLDGRRETILVSLGSRRVIVRVRTDAGESAREFPGADRRLVAHDSVYSIYAIPPGGAPGPLRLVSAHLGSRATATLIRHGTTTTDIGGTARSLLQVTLDAGDATVHLWYDANGRLLKVEVPAQRLTAVRLLAPHR